MSLFNCPECLKKISDQVNTCPNCGFILPRDSAEIEKMKQRSKSQTQQELDKLEERVQQYSRRCAAMQEYNYKKGLDIDAGTEEFRKDIEALLIRMDELRKL